MRVWLIVGVAALAAAGATVGATLATRTALPRSKPAAAAPPLILDLGVRTDPEAQALRRAYALYSKGQRAAAATIFGRYRSLEAQVGAALSDWPAGMARVRAIAAAQPQSALAQLYLGIVLFGDGKPAAAKTAWRLAKRLQPDTAYAISAGDLLHRELPVPGLPQFVPSFAPPAALGRLSPPQQLAYLRVHAHDLAGRLLYGVALQRLDRPVSAERQFAAAAAAAPDDPEALTAKAVGLFDKDDPSPAFSQLGPLARRFPRSQTVRFHLGLLLLWLGQVTQARKELQRARADGPATALGQEAQLFLIRLQKVRTNGNKR